MCPILEGWWYSMGVPLDVICFQIYKMLSTQDYQTIRLWAHSVLWTDVVSTIPVHALATCHITGSSTCHDDIHQMETFSALLALCVVWGIHRSLVNSPHKGQWRVALMFSLIYAWKNSWLNNLEPGNLRCHRAHYDVTVMYGIDCKRLMRFKCWCGWASSHTIQYHLILFSAQQVNESLI